ncbi:hypothetical protein D3C80_1716990 [compost metagenome]
MQFGDFLRRFFADRDAYTQPPTNDAASSCNIRLSKSSVRLVDQGFAMHRAAYQCTVRTRRFGNTTLRVHRTVRGHRGIRKWPATARIRKLPIDSEQTPYVQ